MYWFTLLSHFVSMANWQGDRLYLQPANAQEMDAEGWITLDSLFEGQDFWTNEYWRRQAAFSAALLVDMGFLNRRETAGRVEYRATFKAYIRILNLPGWDAIGTDPEVNDQED